jgi:MSHA pilin protein MshC
VGKGHASLARRRTSKAASPGSAIRHPLSASSSGFTIVELVVVIVLLGILATFAVPRFFSKQPFSARGYSDELASALRYAQKVAVASGCDVSISIDASGYSAAQRALSGSICATSGAWSVPVRRSDDSALAGTAPNDATVGAPVTVMFAGNGGVRGTAPAPIAIGPHTISVDPMTGFVSVQ